MNQLPFFGIESDYCLLSLARDDLRNISSVKMVGCVTIQILPEEMLLKIFCCLGLQDLSTVLLVCKGWKEVPESPWLLTKLEVVVGQMKVNNIGILGTRRLESVKRVRLLSKYHPDEEEAEAVFQAIIEHEGIKELNISQKYQK